MNKRNLMKKLEKAYQYFLIANELDDTNENQKQFVDDFIMKGIELAKYGDVGTPELREKALKDFREFLNNNNKKEESK
jgi:hypothetical protein